MPKELDMTKIKFGRSTVKVFLRGKTPLPQALVASLLKQMANHDIAYLPPNVEVLVVHKNGTVKVF